MPFQFVPKDSQSPHDPLRSSRLSLRDEAIDFLSAETLYCHGRNVHDQTVPVDYIFENRRTRDSWCLQVLDSENCLPFAESVGERQGRVPDLVAVFAGGPVVSAAPSPARLSEALSVLLKRPGVTVHFIPDWTALREEQQRPASQSPDHLYRVVVEGVAEGVTHEPVAARLATRFKRPEQEMLSMVKMDKAVVKRGITFEKAQEYFAVLTDAGCATSLEKESSFD
jgi:hypothetical protein